MGKAVMIELAKRGVGRQEAPASGKHMKDVLVSRPEVTEFISAGEIEGSWILRGISGLLWSRWRLW